MVLERRVRSPDPSGERQTTTGEEGGFGCQRNDDILNTSHDDYPNNVKSRRTQRAFLMRSVLLVILAASLFIIGQEYVESRVHEVENHVHLLENELHNVENSVHRLESNVLQSEKSGEEEVDKKTASKSISNHPEAPEEFVAEVAKKTLRSKSKPTESSAATGPSPLEQQRRPALYGEKLTYGLYRFEAERLGPHFVKAVEYFDSWIGDDVDPVGAAFAKQRVQMPGVAEYHNDCFQAPNVDRMLRLEENKKRHKLGKDRLGFLMEEQALFYNNTADIPRQDLVHITENSQWAWRTSALFSAQYSGTQSQFRHKINEILDQDEYLAGSVSGTFWYPPNAIREWHTNAWDISTNKTTGKMKKPWRMYFVRQKPEKGSDGIVKDRSAFHLMDGNGIPADRLESTGAYRLTHNKENERDVWRLPDQDGYVSLFRLQIDEPYRWHCIVADETVHRYSLGMSLSDDEVEALLEHVGVEL